MNGYFGRKIAANSWQAKFWWDDANGNFNTSWISTSGLGYSFVGGNLNGVAAAVTLSSTAATAEILLKSALAVGTVDDVVRVWSSAGTRVAGNLLALGDGVAYTEKARFGYLGDLVISGVNALGTTPTAAITAQNTTAATAGVPVQFGPMVVSSGTAWDTAASQTCQVGLYCKPTSAASPAATFDFMSKVGAGAWTSMGTWSAGGLTVTNNIQAGLTGTLSVNCAVVQNYSSALELLFKSNLAHGTADDAFRMWAYEGTRTAGNLLALGDGVAYTEKARFGYLGDLVISGVKNIGTTFTPAITAQNTTAAAAGAPQYGPGLVSSGMSWETTGSTSQACQIGLYAQTLSFSSLKVNAMLMAKLGAGAWTEVARFTEGGTFYSTGNIYAGLAAGGTVFCNGVSSQTLYATYDNIVTTPTAAIVARNTTAATAGVPVQYGPMVVSSGTAWDAVSASVTCQAGFYVKPTAGATQYAHIYFAHKVGAGAWTTGFYYDPGNGYLVSSYSLYAGASGQYNIYAASWVNLSTTVRATAQSNLATGTADDAFRFWSYAGTRTAGNLLALGDGAVWSAPKAYFDWSGALSITGNGWVAGIGTAQTAGRSLVNATLAAAGAQQYSPMLVMSGQGWKTDAVAASQAVDFAWQVVPVQGAAAPTGTMTFYSRVNGGAWGARAYLYSSGNFQAEGNIYTGGGGNIFAITLTSASATGVNVVGNLAAANAGTDVIVKSLNARTNGLILDVQNNGVSILKADYKGTLTQTDLTVGGLATTVMPGLTLTNPVAATAGVQNQYGPMIASSGACWDQTGLASVTMQGGMMIRPIAYTGGGASQLEFYMKSGAGVWTQVGYFSPNGQFKAVGAIVSGSNTIYASSYQVTGAVSELLLSNPLATGTVDDVVRVWSSAGTRTAGNLLALGDGAVYAQKFAVDWAGNTLQVVAFQQSGQFASGADPAAPAATFGRTYFRDNGAGKMQYCVRFPTGAVQVIATEP